MNHNPPRLFRFLLRRALPPDVRDDILGDVHERFRQQQVTSPAKARWRYRRIALGLITSFLHERFRERIRHSTRPRISMLDVRVAFRMLGKYPVLSLVGTGSLALAIALGAAVFAFISMLLWPTIPLPDGHRIVSIAVTDVATSESETRLTADYQRWQSAVTTLTDLGAGRGFNRNLTMGDGVIEPINVAEVTASTFTLARISPVAGRVLTPADSDPAASPTMVIGEDLWRRRFGADPEILQRQLILAGTPTAVVGIMPASFRFPSTYEVWVPLRLDRSAAPRTGQELRVWARLAEDVTMALARTELDVVMQASATDWPATHTSLRARIEPLAGSAAAFSTSDQLLIGSINLAIGLLILVISGNVALLMFARAATREPEIMMRTALGATRSRLIRQFFIEAAVLSGLAAAVGLVLARISLGWGISAFALAADDGRPLPFWYSPSLPPLSIAYAIGLALFAATITGVLPALKVTRGLANRLRSSGAGGGGLKFGGIWTVLIVTQIALTIAFPVVTVYVKRDAWQIEQMEVGVPKAELLSVHLARDPELSRDRFAAVVQRLSEELSDVPGVRHVAVADKLPLIWHGAYVVGVDEGGEADRERVGFLDSPVDGFRVSAAAVDTGFFRAFDAEALAGRLFTEADYRPNPQTAIVNDAFVSRVLGGRNPVGRRLHFRDVDRYAGQIPPHGEQPQWIEIVGVVRNLAMATADNPREAGVYLPLDLDTVDAVRVAVRTAGPTTAAANAAREIAARLEPKLRVISAQSFETVNANALREIQFWVTLLAMVSLAALVLSLSGIYTVMSFAVSRRTREVGIRVALGSSRPRVVAAILRAPLMQVAGGIVAGLLLSVLLGGQVALSGRQLLIMSLYIIVMTAICLLACLVPARRAWSVDPVSALRTE